MNKVVEWSDKWINDWFNQIIRELIKWEIYDIFWLKLKDSSYFMIGWEDDESN